MTGGILLPGWDCPSCGVFNGSAKEVLAACRSCGTTRPPSEPNEVAGLRAELKAAYENLTSVQARCTELLLENRQLSHDLIELKLRHAWCVAPTK